MLSLIVGLAHTIFNNYSMLAITTPISNKREWNNCFIKSSTFGIANFYSSLRNVTSERQNVKKIMQSDICRIHFHIRSNAGIMAGNRDLVNQYQKARIALSEIENLIIISDWMICL